MGCLVLLAGGAGLAACQASGHPAGAVRSSRPSVSAKVVLGTPSMSTASPSERDESESPEPTPTPTRVPACHPPDRPVPVAAPPSATAGRVARAWKRIDGWLARHAPRSARSLRGPASPGAIARAQRRVGRPLPPDLIASLRVHDGVRDGPAAFTFPPFHAPLSAARLPAEWHLMCRVIESAGPVEPDDWIPAYTPFAEANDGGYLYTDQRPGRGGHVGEYFAEDGADTARWPASYAAFLEFTAGLLETGRPGPSGFRAAPGHGVLDWKP